MNKIDTILQDCYVIEPNKFRDERGYFSPYYIDKELEELGFQGIKQVNLSSSFKGVLRGLHFQKGTSAQAKIVKVVKGSALVIAVDLREDSPTYKQYTTIVLNEDSDLMFYVPRGFAHGFLALADNTLYQYFVDNDYCPSAESGIAYNSPCLDISWDRIKKAYDIDEFIISDKDKQWEGLE